MLEQVLRLLSEYEPTINAIVGLITLGAAFWGAIQLTLLARRRNHPTPAKTPKSARAEKPTNLWSALLNLGLGRGSRLEELVSVRNVNVALFLILGVSFAWLVVSLFLRSTILLTILNLFVFVIALVAFALQLSGHNGPARWTVLIVTGVWWLGVMLAVGPLRGIEYFLAVLMAFPILIFSRAQLGQMYLAMLAMGLLFLGGFLLHQAVPPLLDLSDEYIRRGYFLNVFFLAAAVYAAVRYYKEFAATNYHLLEDQKRQNDDLVLTMLPEHIASRVSDHEETVAEWHPDATVLYASIPGVEKLYKKMSAVQLVRLLSEIFLRFDRLVAEHGVEKVKTLGTNYLVATGIGLGDEADHGAIAACALAMREAVADICSSSGHPLGFQAGIASGQAVSGVIGEARPCFDIWGEAVELANRMRGFAGNNEVLVNESAYWRLRECFYLARDEDSDRYRLQGAIDG